jgi:hypothetical protein
MNGRKIALPVSLAAVVLALEMLLTATQTASEPLLLVGARILDTRGGRYLPAAAILIAGDHIESISAAAPATLPAGARRIDLSGATLVPGLGDMFAAASPDATADADFYYAMALAHGVTQFRVVGARLPWAASQRDRARSGEILAPRLAIGGPQLDQRPAASFSKRTVADAQAARREVSQQASSGADWVSVGPSTGPDVYKAILSAARAAKLRVSGEPGATAAGDLLRMGVDAIDRIGFFTRNIEDREKELKGRPDYPGDDRDAALDYLWQHASQADLRPAVVKGRRATTLIPLLASFNGTLDADEIKDDAALTSVPDKWRASLTARAHAAGWPRAAAASAAAAARGRMVKALAAAGVRLATGVDAEAGGYNVPGAGVHRELTLLVRAGLSPADAIRAATINCAEMLGSGATLGEIKAGYMADLIAVEGDPLAKIEDLRRIRLLVRGGEALNPADLLAQARRAAR